VVRGFGYYILYREVDSSFISPLNYVNLYFDGIRKFYVSFNYKGFYKERFYVIFRPYFMTLNIKYDDFLMHQDFGFNGVLGFVPYFLLIDHKSSILGYLSEAVNLGIIDDIRLNTVSLGFLYQVSAWREFVISYTLGPYLGGNLSMPYLRFKFNILGMNLGIDYFYFKSPLDDYYLLQVFGEIPLLLRSFIFKPYFGYRYDNLSSQAEITFNGIFAYQPSAFSGIFLAINKTLLKIGDEYINKNEKEVFKIQIGIDILR